MSLINTRLQNFRANTDLDKWETRASRWGISDAFEAQTRDPNGVITEDLKKKAIASVGSQLQVPVIDYDAGVQVQNITIPLVVSGSPNTSQLVNITFTNYYWGFLIHPAQHFNNEISMQREFNKQMTKHIYKFMDMRDIACGAALETVKTQVLEDDLGGRYSLVGNTVIAPQAEKDYFLGDLNVLNAGNDFFGPLTIVGNGSLQSHLNRIMEKQEFNTDNKSYQWNDKTWHFSNNIANGAGHRATGFALQQGSVGLLEQFLPDCVMGNTTRDGREWGIERLPIADVNIGTFGYEGAVNGSALAGAATAHLTATKVEAYAFHKAIAYITPYNSVPATKPSSTMKFALSAT